MDHAKRYKILLVDDDPNCLDAVDQILRREGYETFPVEEGQAVEKIVTEIDIDLAIVDFDLRDTDGLHVLYKVKRRRRNLPVIIMTARASNEIRDKVLKAGANGFIPKPINIPRFRQSVANILRTPPGEGVEIRRQMVVTRWIRRWIINR